MQAWDPGTNASLSLAHEYRMSLKNCETQGEMVLVGHNRSKHLLSSDVDHGTKWFVTYEKRSQFGLVQQEIKRFVNLGVTLLHSPLVHLFNRFLTVMVVTNDRVGDPVKTWSFV